MALTYPTKIVTVTAITGAPATWEHVGLLFLNNKPGSGYGRCHLQFPAAYALDQLPAHGTEITVTYNALPIFIGRVINYPAAVSENSEQQVAICADIRWEMSKRRIGQYGIGILHPTAGAFPEVGFHIHFNPEGRANRAAAKAEGEDFFRFSSLATAVHWTRRDIVEFLHHFYFSDLMTLTAATLSAAWDEPELNWMPYLMNCDTALAHLANRSGESWAPSYAVGEEAEISCVYTPVILTPTETAEIVLNEVSPETPAKASDSTDSHALNVEGDISIENSCDQVEVHSNKMLVETTYKTDGDSPLLARFSPASLDYPYGLSVDVTMYEAHKLGYNLAAGSLPKRWARQNVTFISGTYAFLYCTADAADLLAGNGGRVLPENCVWFNVTDAGYGVTPGMYRITDGFVIDFERCLILFQNEVASGETKIPLSVRGLASIEVWFTVATEIEVNRIYRTAAPAAWHIDETHPIIETVFRSDIRPQRRRNSVLPDLLSSDLNAQVTAGVPGEGEDYEIYNDESDVMEDVAVMYLETRKEKAVQVSVRCVDIPDNIKIGMKLNISPAVIGLSGKEVITHLLYDFNAGDHLTIMATNNFAEILQ